MTHSGVPATCHPDRPRKLKDGTCDRCYAHDRYRASETVRNAVKARSREWWHRHERTLTPEQQESRRVRARARYAENPRIAQSAVLKQSFGITLDEYDEMLDAQGGTCAICKRVPLTTRRHAVDHDHESGIIRGLLCGVCNTGLGLFHSDAERMMAAIDYLLEWRREVGRYAT